MNSYPAYNDSGELDRRPRLPGGMALGDAIGSMIAATVFGLTRAVDELDWKSGRAGGRRSSEPASIVGGDAVR